MRININNWKVINNKLPLFALFCFLGILYLGSRVNCWYFLLLTLIPFTLRKQKLNWQQISILITITFVFVILIMFAYQFSLLSLIKPYINKVREPVFNFLDKQYSKEISSFIKLILFNIKTEETYEFLHQTIDLGVVWLICVSGFHISLINKCINLICRNKKILAKYINISFVLIYSILLNLTYASIRILLKLCFSSLFYRFKTERFDKVGFIGLLICLLNPSCFSNTGFLLTFAISIGANCIAKLELNNKIINTILINLISFVITIPFVIKMNHKISLFTFINTFIFTYISSFVFLYFLIFAWMPFMQIIHYGIMVGCYVLVGNISFSNIYIWCSTWPPYLIAIYYIILFVIVKIIYLIVYNNKI